LYLLLSRALAGRTLFITGASRGIGKAIAIKAARDGANVVIAAKTTEPHPKLPGTIYTAAKEGILVYWCLFSVRVFRTSCVGSNLCYFNQRKFGKLISNHFDSMLTFLQNFIPL